MGAGICLALALPVSMLSRRPFQRLAPFRIVLICCAALQATRSLPDIRALLGVAIMGVRMKPFGWSRPALFIGSMSAP